MTQEELRLKITTLADTVGLEKTAVALEKLKDESQDAGGATDKASDNIKAMNAASALSSGNLVAMARSAAGLSRSLEGLQEAVPYIMAISAALAAVMKALSAYRDAQEEMRKTLENIKTDNAVNAVENLAGAYDRLKTSMNDATTKANELMDLEKSMVEVARQNAIARENLRLATAIAATTDPAERARLTALIAAAQAAKNSKPETRNPQQIPNDKSQNPNSDSHVKSP